MNSIKAVGRAYLPGGVEFDKYEIFDARELGSNTMSLYDSLGVYKF